MKMLVVGAGMYVTGRAGTGAGTVLASLAQFSLANRIDEVVVVARNPANASVVAEASERINALIGSRLKVRYVSLGSQDLEPLLSAEDFDSALVSVPDHMHFAITCTLLRARIPCLVVKPLVPTLREGRELVRLSREQRCYGAVELHKRFDETNLYARRVLDAGELGNVLYFDVDYSQRISIPTVVFREWAERTNIFQYLGVHYVDLIHFLTGARPTRAMAVGTSGALRDAGIDTFDSVHAMVDWQLLGSSKRTFTSQFNISWVDPIRSSAMSDQKYKIVGTSGRLELDQKNRGVELVTGDGISALNPYFSEFLPGVDGKLHYGGYGLRSIERFLLDVGDLACGNVSPADLESTRPSFVSALPATAVIDAVNASLVNESRWEEIGEIL